MRSESIKEIATALSKAQGQFDHAKKDVKNEFFKSKYADLASVIDAAKKPLFDNGLSVAQITDFDESGMYLETILMHTSGEWISSRYPIRPVKPDPQAVGSAITYARRYAYSALTGIASDDDDGNDASQPKKQTDEEMQKAKDAILVTWLASLDKANSKESLDKIWESIPPHLTTERILLSRAAQISKKFKAE